LDKASIFLLILLCMKPANLTTKIFLDSGDPLDTQKALDTLGFLDGQTTNPTLIAKSPGAKARLSNGEVFTPVEILEYYKATVQEISTLIPLGSVSIEVSADTTTTADEMLNQAREMYTWISNAHIKFPTNKAGLKAAHRFIQEGGRVNMTLCFSQTQAAAVHCATLGANSGDVFYSSFIGRMYDNHESGLDNLRNTIKMYAQSSSHVQTLACSFREYRQFLACLQAGADIITMPLALMQQWRDNNFEIPGTDFTYSPDNIQPIEYTRLDLSQPWDSFEIKHPLTEQGIEKFATDWHNLTHSS
jgi:transaldolase